MLQCKEFTRRIASGHWDEPDWRGRMSIRFHVFMCKFCRRYLEQIQSLRNAARRIWSGPPSQEERDSAKRIQAHLKENYFAQPPGGNDRPH